MIILPIVSRLERVSPVTVPILVGESLAEREEMVSTEGIEPST
jgi:hypothetical protein